ncbi:MAG: O-antigen ligase family protein [Lachnospiraceae bacterium]|nr:O-antigen ligase family protein [Lachnospiraceae bacterium]
MKKASQKPFEIAVTIYIFAIMCILPLFMLHGYRDMAESKFGFFKVSSLLLMYFVIGLFVICIIFDNKLKLFNKQKPSTIEIFVLYFLFATVLSWLLCDYRYDALWGYEGWNMGLFTQLILVFVFFCVSNASIPRKQLLYGILITATIEYIIAILQRYGLNPLGLYDNIKADYRFEFISTVGQKTWFTSYTMIIAPFGIYAFFTEKKTRIKILLGLFIYLQTCVILVSYTDSALAGLIVIIALTGWFCLKDSNLFFEFAKVLLISSISLLSIGLTRIYLADYRRILEDEHLTMLLTDPRSGVALAILSLAVFILLGILHNKKMAGQGSPLHKLRILYLTLTVLCGISAVIVICITNNSISSFNDSWGNNRGFIWRIAMQTFSNGSTKDKLIGVGPDMFWKASDTLYHDEINSVFKGTQLPNAHNEWLNALVTEGVLGCVAYMGIFIFALYSGVKKSKDDLFYVPLTIAVAAYMVHNTFCYQQCICTPLIFIVFGMINSKR